MLEGEIKRLPKPKTLYSQIGDLRLYEIAKCESGLRQFRSDGSVVRSHTNDVGILQINVPVWGREAQRLGYDIYSLEGNIRMAHYVLKVQGYSAWVCNRKI